jgi:hypothetical protein
VEERERFVCVFVCIGVCVCVWQRGMCECVFVSVCDTKKERERESVCVDRKTR